MDKRMYPRLALDCLRKNAKFYTPYLLTVAGAAAAFYMLATTSDPAGLGAQTDRGAVLFIMKLCTVMLGLVCAGFLLYTNSFLMKQRSREFGLYSVLGMNRQNLTRLLLWETAYTALLGLGGGLMVGAVFDRLLLLCLGWIMDVPLTGPVIYWRCLGLTALVFGGILLLTFAINTARVGLIRPAELMVSGRAGDRTPRGSAVLGLLGLLGAAALGYGYYLAITVQQGMQRVQMSIIYVFFYAVLLVIAGTYLLFLAGSVTGLTLLRRWKGYYYKVNHFISVSGLIHRMGRNAAGLATICILSTTVLVMVSSTTSLYAGMGQDVDELYPRDVLFHWSSATEFDWDAIRDDALTMAEDNGYHPENIVRFTMTRRFSGSAKRDVFVITADGYESITGKPVTVAPGHVLLTYAADRLELGGDVYDLTVETLPQGDPVLAYFGNEIGGLYDGRGVAVVPDEETLISLIPELEEEYMGTVWSYITYYLGFDLPPGEDMTACRESIGEKVNNFLRDNANGYGTAGSDRADYLHGLRIEYGGLLFLGAFLGVLFLAGAALIIYYKQMAEGHEDRERFAIMEKVGLDRAMAAKAIRSQILLVFFLPLGLAVCHLAAAYPMIVRLLKLYGMEDTGSYIFCAGASVAGFAVIYTLVYWLTTRAYSRLVRQPGV